MEDSNHRPCDQADLLRLSDALGDLRDALVEVSLGLQDQLWELDEEQRSVVVQQFSEVLQKLRSP